MALKFTGGIKIPTGGQIQTTIAGTGGGGSTDPDFASVEVLLQGEAFTDASNVGRTITGNGSSTAGVVAGKFGNAYNIPDSALDTISISGDMQFPGDFTIECWTTQAVTGVQRSIYVVSNGAANSFLAINYTPPGTFNIYLNTSSPAFNVAGTLDSTFRHVALTRTGTALKLFLDGIELQSVVNAATLGFTSAGLNRLGGDGANASGEAIDDFRITKGVGRYTANFTPPTAEFPTS